MESSARFPEIEATDLLKMRENNQNKNTQRSTNTWVKVFDLWRAERSEVRKLEEIPEDELDDILCRFYAEIRKQNGDEYEPVFSNLKVHTGCCRYMIDLSVICNKHIRYSKKCVFSNFTVL
jgi:uncharacterized protein YjiS (DUF1127 family)